MKDKNTQKWIPLYIDKWIFGSTRIELAPDERGVFIDLLCLAAKDKGYIRANETIGYLPRQLAGLLNIPEELLLRTIEKCVKYEKIQKLENNIFHVKNWDEYQFSRQYMTKFRDENVEKINTFSKSVNKNVNTSLQKCRPILYNNIREDKRIENIPPLIPPDKQGGHDSVNNVEQTKPSKIAYNEKKTLDNRDTAQAEQKSNGGAFTLDSDKIKNKLINWDNAKSDNQKFISFWIKIDNPTLYKTATSDQIKGVYGRFAKATKAILDIAGDLETAKKAASMCRDWLKSKNLDYTLETISKHLVKFVDGIKRNEILPPEVDSVLWSQYCELREIKKGKFDKIKAINELKNIISISKNPNNVLEQKIIELKRNNLDVPEIIKKIDIKTIGDKGE